MKPIVIVGAGTAGLYLANQLVLKGKSVILLEAGSMSISSYHSSEYESVGHKNNGISIGRSKGIGGTSNLWGGQLAEFTEDEFKGNNFYNQPIWPFNWKELNDYYDLVYDNLGFNKNRPRTTIIFESLDEEGLFLEKFYSRWLRVPNFKKLFYEKLKESSQFKVIENAVLDGLKFNNDVCYELTYIQGGVKQIIVDFESLILANGTVEIVRSLLVAAKNENVPFKSNKLIGAYFQDHLFLTVGKISDATKAFIDLYSNEVINGEKLQPKLRLRSIEKNEFVQLSAFFHFSSKYSEKLQLLKQFLKAITGSAKIGTIREVMILFFKLLRAMPIIFPVVFNYLKSNKIYNPLSSDIFLVVQAQQISIIDSMIRISDTEVDIYSRPRVYLDWKIDGRELCTINSFIELFEKYLKNQKLGSLIINKSLRQSIENSDRLWLDEVTDIYHNSGGAIMGVDPNKSVVDANLKVWGTQNLYIVGGAVLPTSSYANTGLTILALAHRLADHLDLEKGS